MTGIRLKPITENNNSVKCEKEQKEIQASFHYQCTPTRVLKIFTGELKITLYHINKLGDVAQVDVKSAK